MAQSDNNLLRYAETFVKQKYYRPGWRVISENTWNESNKCQKS